MELLEYLEIIKKRKWLIIIITVIAVLASAIYSIFIASPVYEAKSTLIVGRTPDNSQSKIQYNDILAYQQLIKTYSELAKSDLVASQTISNLGLNMTTDALLKNLKVTPRVNTQILDIVIDTNDPKTAMDLTNTLSKVFVENVKKLMNSDDVKILDEAKLPKSPIKPKKTLNILIALVLGLMVSLGIAFLLEYMDNTIKTEDDVQKYLGLSVLAAIPYHEGGKR